MPQEDDRIIIELIDGVRAAPIASLFSCRLDQIVFYDTEDEVYSEYIKLEKKIWKKNRAAYFHREVMMVPYFRTIYLPQRGIDFYETAAALAEYRKFQPHHILLWKGMNMEYVRQFAIQVQEVLKNEQNKRSKRKMSELYTNYIELPDGDKEVMKAAQKLGYQGELPTLYKETVRPDEESFYELSRQFPWQLICVSWFCWSGPNETHECRYLDGECVIDKIIPEEEEDDE